MHRENKSRNEGSLNRRMSAPAHIYMFVCLCVSAPCAPRTKRRGEIRKIKIFQRKQENKIKLALHFAAMQQNCKSLLHLLSVLKRAGCAGVKVGYKPIISSEGVSIKKKDVTTRFYRLVLIYNSDRKRVKTQFWRLKSLYMRSSPLTMSAWLVSFLFVRHWQPYGPSSFTFCACAFLTPLSAKHIIPPRKAALFTTLLFVFSLATPTSALALLFFRAERETLCTKAP